MFTENTLGLSSGIVQNWSMDGQHVHSGKNKGCKCGIIPPSIHIKIAEHYNNPDFKDRHAKALKNHVKSEKMRVDRCAEHRNQRMAIAMKKTNLAHVPVITVYETKSEKNLPGKLVKSDKIQTNNIFANEAFYGAKNTLEFWLQIFKRNSYDNHGADLLSSIGTGENYDNAYWNGEQMYYGRGDVNVFTRFTIDQDIITHEMTHAMTGIINDLEYEGQSGAINEHYSDVIGIMAKQFYGGKPVRETFLPNKIKPETVDESNWLIGDEVLLDLKKVKYALRSMEHPGTGYVDHPILGTDDQPASADAYVELPKDDAHDNGGVHKYSGFLNRAFCLAAKQLGGYAWNHVGQIWYDALPLLSSKANFVDLAKATIDSAGKRFGDKSKEADAVRYAWATVKVYGH